jgi:kynurenine formamidase
MRVIDLSQTMIGQMQVYPGDQPPVLIQTHSLTNDHYTNHKLTTGMHAGTHIDGPWHMVGDRFFLSNMPSGHFIGKGCVIDIRNETVFNDCQKVKEIIQDCSIVLFYTGYGELFGSEKYLSDYPVIANEVAEVMVNLGVKMMGIDAFSPDNAPYPVHKTLLGNNVLIAENLVNLHLLINEPHFEVIALPLKIEADSAPARIIAIINN